MNVQTLERGQQCFCVGPNLLDKSGHAVILISDTKPTTRIDVSDSVTVPPKNSRQLSHSLHGGREWLHICNLRANVHADPGDLQRLHFRRTTVKRASIFNGDAELVLMETRGNIRMGLGGNVGVYPQGNSR